MKEITKEEMEVLVDKKIIKNTSKGFTDKFGNEVGFYRTRNKRYIEDKFADMAKKFS